MRAGRSGVAMVRALVALAGISMAATAAAEVAYDGTEPAPSYASPRWGSVEVSVSGYTPMIDSEFGGAANPYLTAFGSSRHYLVRADFSYSIFVDKGTLDVGVGLGFTQMNGHGLNLDGSVSADTTRLRILPARLSVTYRYDIPALRWGIPLVPFARLTLDRYWWWAYNGGNDVANANGLEGKGATMGWSFGGGLAFLLDWVDPGLARELDRNTGINNTFLFVEFTKSYIDDFGSATSWNLSNDRVAISGGLLFTY
jgi:hypothetical protein